MQIAGAVIAAGVGVLVLWFLFVRRHAVRGWLATRSRGARIALAAVALLLIVGVGSMGAATWNYTQHSNDFCVGCHVMNPAFHKFANETNKHAELSCHDCHQQPLSASARQLYLWVAERPEEIGEHAKVPNSICEGCHVTGDTATWQHCPTSVPAFTWSPTRRAQDFSACVSTASRCTFGPWTKPAARALPTSEQDRAGKNGGPTVIHCTAATHTAEFRVATRASARAHRFRQGGFLLFHDAKVPRTQ